MISGGGSGLSQKGHMMGSSPIPGTSSGIVVGLAILLR